MCGGGGGSIAPAAAAASNSCGNNNNNWALSFASGNGQSFSLADNNGQLSGSYDGQPLGGQNGQNGMQGCHGRHHHHHGNPLQQELSQLLGGMGGDSPFGGNPLASLLGGNQSGGSPFNLGNLGGNFLNGLSSAGNNGGAFALALA